METITNERARDVRTRSADAAKAAFHAGRCRRGLIHQTGARTQLEYQSVAANRHGAVILLDHRTTPVVAVETTVKRCSQTCLDAEVVPRQIVVFKGRFEVQVVAEENLGPQFCGALRGLDLNGTAVWVKLARIWRRDWSVVAERSGKAMKSLQTSRPAANKIGTVGRRLCGELRVQFRSSATGRKSKAYAHKQYCPYQMTHPVHVSADGIRVKQNTRSKRDVYRRCYS